jgi:ubiquinone/menaquinone biosynthesis C-methylase UbiE
MSHHSNSPEIAAAYNQWAETYDTNPNRTRDLAAHALRHTDLQINGRGVVEIGCGTGRNTVWLAEQARDLRALDFSHEMLARAKDRVKNPRVRFLQHDVCGPWPLESASADVVIAMLILEHVEQLHTVFAEAARVLVRGGEFFVCELHPMRQLTGGQAQFSNTKTGERQLVKAFIHDVSEYVNTGLAIGFELLKLNEWRDDEAERNSPPRLLSVLFRLSETSLKI